MTRISNTSFIRCKSLKGKGGAVFYECPDNAACTMEINSYTMNENEAIIGGAMYWNYKSPIFTDKVSLVGNIASFYGNDFTSYPSNIKFYNPDTKTLEES
jgi:hypothetical protein